VAGYWVAAVAVASAVALIAAVFALIISVGTAIRLQRSQGTGQPAALGGLSAGTPVSNILLPVLDPAAGDGWLQGPSLVIFASAGCQPCRDLFASLDEDRLRGFKGRLLLVDRSQKPDTLETARIPGAGYRIDADGQLAGAFHARGTPHTFLIRNGRIADQALGADITKLLAKASLSAN
jgi:hypothetical protein